MNSTLKFHLLKKLIQAEVYYYTNKRLIIASE